MVPVARPDDPRLSDLDGGVRNSGQGPVRHQDLDDAYQARTPISYLGPIDDPEFPGVAHSGEIEALVILIQENKSLAGEVMMYTYILDLVRPLKFEREGDTSG